MLAAIEGVLLGILAGWAVNVLADTIPARRSFRETWRWPFQRLAQMGPATPPALPAVRRYLLVWLAAIALGWFAHSRFGWTPKALLIALEAWFFLAIAVIDLEHRLVLNRMLLAAAPVILVANLLLGDVTWISLTGGAVAGAGLFWLLALVTPGGLGMGDVKLAGLIGLTIGLTYVWFALAIGILAGGVAALALLIKSRFQWDLTIAYAPYLVVGVWVMLLGGTEWVAIYLARL
jgi:prepilin signal peptidase PulO-like enzyme (type II secretory pathway)